LDGLGVFLGNMDSILLGAYQALHLRFLAARADTLRPFCCFECIDFMHKGSPAYIHGSNLLIRSDVEEEVGWENGKTIAEDTLFAVSARTKCGSNSFGWHGGVIEEKSPLSLRDLVKQRKRWFYGLIQNLKFIPLKERIVQGSRALLWSLGFYSGIVSIIALFVYQDMSLGYSVANLHFLSSLKLYPLSSHV
jgi:egghead protein (zeste-white 4 protein)